MRGKFRLALSRTWIPPALILGFVLLVFLGEGIGLYENQELGFVDLRFLLRGARAPHPDIAIVDIDDESISRIGHWPWPRGYHATLLEVLNSYHPRLILYDVLFTEASTQPQDDQLLAYAMKKAGNVVSAFFYHTEKPFFAFFPLAPFREASRVLGYVNISPDRDGRIRRIRPRIQTDSGPYHHTSAAAVLEGFQNPADRLRWLNQIPVDPEGSLWINYPGRFSLFPRIPFHRILEQAGTNDPELEKIFRGKIVIVGETATGGGDIRPTPFSPAYPGVGIQASAIHTFLTGQYLRRFGLWVRFGILVLITLLVAFLTWKFPPLIALTMVSVLTGFYLVWNFLLFSFLGWILPVFPILLDIVGTYFLVLFLQYLQMRFEGELLLRELSWAARIQENFLPQEQPRIEGLDIGFQCRFAKMVGGDLYDWIPLGARRFGICVGDVSGKGVPAALYMARVISEWRSLAKDFSSPSQLMNALNERLVSSGAQGIFVTLLYLILDLDSRTLMFSNAGHEPLFFFEGRTRRSEWIKRAAAVPLGLFGETRYPEETLSVQEGDFVILISDGVRELRNPWGEELGLAGTEKALDSRLSESADQTVKHLFSAMDEYARGNPAHDDRTVLCMKIGKGGSG